MPAAPEFTVSLRILGWRRGDYWVALTYCHQPNVTHLVRATRS